MQNSDKHAEVAMNQPLVTERLACCSVARLKKNLYDKC